MPAKQIVDLVANPIPLVGTERVEIQRAGAGGAGTSFSNSVSELASAPKVADPIVTGAAPFTADPTATLYAITTGGTMGTEVIDLPLLPTPIGGFLNPNNVGKLIGFYLAVQTDPADVVSITVNGSGFISLFPRYQLLEQQNTTAGGVILDFVGAVAFFIWSADGWSFYRILTSGNDDTSFQVSNVTLSADNGSGVDSGGAISIRAGHNGNGAGAAAPGSVDIAAGDQTDATSVTIAGHIDLIAGASNAAGTPGGPITITPGDNSAVGGVGGLFLIEAGSATGAASVGGSVEIRSGPGDAGGAFNIFGGSGNTGDGSLMQLFAGGSVSGDGGYIHLQAGDSDSGDGGDLILNSGSSNTGPAGNITIQPQAGAGAVRGHVVIQSLPVVDPAFADAIWINRGLIAASGAVPLSPLTVAALTGGFPAGTAGRRGTVNNALAPAFGAVVVGGGAVTVPVYDDGAAWRVG